MTAAYGCAPGHARGGDSGHRDARGRLPAAAREVMVEAMREASEPESWAGMDAIEAISAGDPDGSREYALLAKEVRSPGRLGPAGPSEDVSVDVPPEPTRC